MLSTRSSPTKKTIETEEKRPNIGTACNQKHLLLCKKYLKKSNYINFLRLDAHKVEPDDRDTERDEEAGQVDEVERGAGCEQAIGCAPEGSGLCFFKFVFIFYNEFLSISYT